MATKGADSAYTQLDHSFRDEDRYAQAKYKLTERWLRPIARPGMTLANIGCGSGYFNDVAVRLGLNVTGCEPDPEALAIARRRSSASQCTLYNCGLLEFAEKDISADIVTMHDVLEHIEDEDAAAAAVSRVLKDDGVLVLSVPALQSLFGAHDVALGHYRRYSKRTLRAALQGRFTFDRLRYFAMLSIPIVLYYSTLRQGSYPTAGGKSALMSAYGTVCDLETYWSPPLGTSLIAMLHKAR